LTENEHPIESEAEVGLEYAEPQVVDYGSLTEITLSGGPNPLSDTWGASQGGSS
jgi:hypothetical protein